MEPIPNSTKESLETIKHGGIKNLEEFNGYIRRSLAAVSNTDDKTNYGKDTPGSEEEKPWFKKLLASTQKVLSTAITRAMSGAMRIVSAITPKLKNPTFNRKIAGTQLTIGNATSIAVVSSFVLIAIYGVIKVFKRKKPNTGKLAAQESVTYKELFNYVCDLNESEKSIISMNTGFKKYFNESIHTFTEADAISAHGTIVEKGQAALNGIKETANNVDREKNKSILKKILAWSAGIISICGAFVLIGYKIFKRPEIEKIIDPSQVTHGMTQGSNIGNSSVNLNSPKIKPNVNPSQVTYGMTQGSNIGNAGVN